MYKSITLEIYKRIRFMSKRTHKCMGKNQYPLKYMKDETFIVSILFIKIFPHHVSATNEIKAEATDHNMINTPRNFM